MFVSVVIPTRDRAAKLRNLLSALSRLEIPPEVHYEIIVADNGSVDDTSRVCAEAERDFSARIRRVYVPRPGRSGAANCGIQEAKGEIIAMLDDDVYPSLNWLTTIFEEFSQDPSLGLLCGRVELWDPKALALSVRMHDRREQFSCVSDAYNLFIGACLVVRRTILCKVGGYDADFGPGVRIPAAEDTDLIYRVALAGERLVYSPQLVTHHDHGRCDAATSYDLRKAYVFGRGAFFGKYLLHADLRVARTVYWEIGRCLSGPNRVEWRHLAWLTRGLSEYVSLRIVRLFNPLRWRRGMTGEGRVCSRVSDRQAPEEDSCTKSIS